jgi:hypothetical protein
MVPLISTSEASMRSAANRPASGWLTPAGDVPADLQTHRRLRGGFAENVRDRDGAAPQVERDLAVRGLGAGRAQIGEGRIHFARNALLEVEFETEIAARRDHDGGDQPGKNLDHEEGSDCRERWSVPLESDHAPDSLHWSHFLRRPVSTSPENALASQITYSEVPLDGSVAWLRAYPTICGPARSSITARRSPESSKSSRPSRSATSATWRWPIRRAWRRPARRSSRIRGRRRS